MVSVNIGNMNEASPENPFNMSLNRSERRASEKVRKKFAGRKIAASSIIQLHSIDTLLDNETEDVDFYNSEISNLARAIDLSRTSFRYFTILMNTGVSDATIRTHLLNFGNENYDPHDFSVAISNEIIRSKFVENSSILTLLERKIQRSNTFRLEDNELYLMMLQDDSVRAVDMYSEITRSLEETASLLQLEINWLLDQERKRLANLEVSKEQRTDEIQVELDEGQKKVEDENPFLLSNWDLYWTKRHWSKEENQLVKIPTGSREEAIEHTRTVTLGEIMIKPGSVVRALEFFLQKDIIQRALSSRLRHVPDSIKEWIKIKRGRDRILLAVPEEGKAIFFAGNRDVIYRNI